MSWSHRRPAPPGGSVGTWQEVIWQLIAQRALEAGAQVQLATEEWDGGPIVAYCTFSLRGPLFDPLWKGLGGRTVEQLKAEEGEKNPLFRAIRAEEVRWEVPLFLATLRAFALGRLRAEGGWVVNERGEATTGHDMTDEIAARLDR